MNNHGFFGLWKDKPDIGQAEEEILWPWALEPV